MFRSISNTSTKLNLSWRYARMQRFYSTIKNENNRSRKGGKVFAIIATAGFGFAGALVYGMYDPKFKSLLQDNVPYLKDVYKMLPDWNQKNIPPTKEIQPLIEKSKAIQSSPSLLKKKPVQVKEVPAEETKATGLVKTSSETIVSEDIKSHDENISLVLSEKPAEQIINVNQNNESLEKSIEEKLLKDLIQNLQSQIEELSTSHKDTVKAIQVHTKKLYDALDMSEGKEGDIVWIEVDKATAMKNASLNLATQKANDTRNVIEKLQVKIKSLSSKNGSNPLLKSAEETVSQALYKLQQSEAEVAEAELEAKTASEYKDLVNKSKEQFKKELQIVLPKYVQGDKDKPPSEDELNLLIAHAYRRIEQLQKQIAKLQVTEKNRIDQALNLQRKEHEQMINSRVEYEMEKQKVNFEKAVENRLEEMEEEFEAEMRQQLSRQAAAHADHLQEALRVREQELDRKHSLDLEEKLLHQKGIFISEVSGSMAHLKGIVVYMRSKREFDKASKRAQAFYLACQSMDSKINIGIFGKPSPLGKELATIKSAAEDDNEFINIVLATIPIQAVDRGVFTSETLKDRFKNVKRVCRRVASINENNNSLYKYFLCYLQSFLIVDATSIPKEELEGKVAVDPSEWDTFDILNRISYSLKVDDIEQALRYANLLKGESQAVAKDWISEVRLLLETKLAVKALLAHASAVGVQAYH